MNINLNKDEIEENLQEIHNHLHSSISTYKEESDKIFKEVFEVVEKLKKDSKTR